MELLPPPASLVRSPARHPIGGVSIAELKDYCFCPADVEIVVWLEGIAGIDLKAGPEKHSNQRVNKPVENKPVGMIVMILFSKVLLK